MADATLPDLDSYPVTVEAHLGTSASVSWEAIQCAAHFVWIPPIDLLLHGQITGGSIKSVS